MISATRTPALLVQVGGAALERADADTLATIRVHQVLSRPSECELTFLEPRGAIGKGTQPTAGAAVSIRDREALLPLFSGEVTSVEYCYGPAQQREVCVRAEDRMHRLRRRQPLHAYVDISPQELARELAGGLGVTVRDERTGPGRPRVVHYNRSALSLLTGTLEQAGLYWTLREDVLHIVSLDGADAPPVRLKLGDSLLRARVEIDHEAAVPSVSAVAWDYLHGTVHKGRATQPLGAPAGATEEVTLGGLAAQSDAGPEAAARALLERRRAQARVIAGAANGDPRLRPGARVAVSGLSPAADGDFVLTSVTHSVTAESGFVSEFSSRPPDPAVDSSGVTSSLGIVTRVDDPESLGRVRVTLPAYGDVETDWLQVVLPGAGRDKGLMALPAPTDRVVVLFPGQNPSDGVVLGGIHGPGPAPDTGVVSGTVQRFTFRTPGGHEVQLDDEAKIVRVRDSKGSVLELGPEKVRLHAETDLDIDAPQRTVRIRAAKIDFERL